MKFKPLFLLLLLLFNACQASPEQAGCERIISLSPSITETLYAMNLGRNIVGVTRFCSYPPDAKSKASVGGYIDPDIETMIRLKPTLVILREEQSDIAQRVKNFGLRTLNVEHRNIPGIMASFKTIGDTCKREALAQTITTSIHTEMTALKDNLKTTHHRPKVLVVVERDIQYDTVRHLYVAGQDGFYDWLVREAGGRNVAPLHIKGFAQVSSEGILRMNPDIIIDIIPDVVRQHVSSDQLLSQWSSLKSVSAVKNKKIHLLGEEYMLIPGPRFMSILKRFTSLIHPELSSGAQKTP